MTTEQIAHADRYLAGVTFFSTGACPGCADCGLPKPCDNCDGLGTAEGEPCECCNGKPYVEPTEHERDCAQEPHFSWSQCETCGSTLGGDRHPAHGWLGDKLCHFDICTDCLLHFNGCDD